MTNRKTGRHLVINPSQMKVLKVKWLRKNKPDASGNYECWICHQPIAADKLTLDHVASVHDYPEYAFALSNLRPAHNFCNQEREFSTLSYLRGRKILKRF